jgi:hypothetical protein
MAAEARKQERSAASKLDLFILGIEHAESL